MSVEEDRAQRRKAREEHRKEVALCYKRCFMTEDGKAVMADIHSVFGLDMPEMISTATRPGDRIQYDMGYIGIRSGQRQVVMHIQKQISLALMDPLKVEPTEVLTGTTE